MQSGKFQFKYVKFAALVLLFIAALCGCESTPAPTAETVRTLTNHSAKPDIRGKVTGISQTEDRVNAIEVEGVLSADIRYDRASVRITAHTRIFLLGENGYTPASVSQIEIGQQVEVLFVSIILERYPVSAEADEIIILPVSDIPAPTPEPTPTSVPRWQIYETALSQAVLNTTDGLCEWEILGVGAHEVYVFTLCKVRAPIGSAGFGPAVIYLAENGSIEKVTIPRDGTYYGVDIEALFPADIRDKAYQPDMDGPKAEAHIIERLKTNGPPLIALAGTPLP